MSSLRIDTFDGCHSGGGHWTKLMSNPSNWADACSRLISKSQILHDYTSHFQLVRKLDLVAWEYTRCLSLRLRFWYFPHPWPESTDEGCGLQFLSTENAVSLILFINQRRNGRGFRERHKLITVKTKSMYDLGDILPPVWEEQEWATWWKCPFRLHSRLIHKKFFCLILLVPYC